MSRYLCILIGLLFLAFGLTTSPVQAQTDTPVPSTGTPEGGSGLYCYIYKLWDTDTNSAGEDINIEFGFWDDENGIRSTLDGVLRMNWSEEFLVHTTRVQIYGNRVFETPPSMSLEYVADAFGQDIFETTTLNSGGLFLFDYPNESPLTSGDDFSIDLQASQQIIIQEIVIFTDVSLFPRNDCVIEQEATNTPTTSPTASPTPVCTNTTYDYPNTDYPTHYSGDFYFFNNAGIVLNGAGDSGDWIRPSELDAYVTDIDFKLTRSSVAVYSTLTIQVNSVQFQVNPSLWNNGHGEINAVHIVLSDWGFQAQNVSEVTFTAGNSHPDGSVAIRGVTVRICSVPTATPSQTNTPLGVPSKTATGTGIAVATRTNTLTPNPSLTSEPSATPEPNTSTPVPASNTPLPSITPPNTSTNIPLPTAIEGTTTPWATYPGANLTPLPGTPDFGDGGVSTPGVGTLASTPTVIVPTIPVPDDLTDTHDTIEDNLRTAVVYVNTLPQDFSQMYPHMDALPQAASYAKWITSVASCQEIFGKRLCPIPLHLGYGLAVVLFTSWLIVMFRIALWFFRLAIWILRSILKIIPFIG